TIPDRRQTRPRRFVDVEVEIRERNDRLRVPIQVLVNRLHRIALDQLVLLDVRNRTFLFVVVEDLCKVFVVVLRHVVRADTDDLRLSVLRVDRRKSLEGVEADDLAVVVERLVDSAQRLVQGEIASPANTELHDDAVDVDDLLVQLVDEQDLGKILTTDEQAEVAEQLVSGNRTLLEVPHETLANRRLPVGIVPFGLDLRCALILRICHDYEPSLLKTQPIDRIASCTT